MEDTRQAGTDASLAQRDLGTAFADLERDGFCVIEDKKFSIPGRGNCAARGYDRRRFFRVDTNDNLNQVQNLQ